MGRHMRSDNTLASRTAGTHSIIKSSDETVHPDNKIYEMVIFISAFLKMYKSYLHQVKMTKNKRKKGKKKETKDWLLDLHNNKVSCIAFIKWVK